MFLLSYDIVQGSPCIDIECLISRSTTLLSLLKLQWVIYGQQNEVTNMSTEQKTQGGCSNHAPFYHVLDVNLPIRLWIKIKLRYQD